jgi:hypothetical protein
MLLTIKQLYNIDPSIIITGSTVLYLQGKNVIPNDIDVIVKDINLFKQHFPTLIVAKSNFGLYGKIVGVMKLNNFKVDLFQQESILNEILNIEGMLLNIKYPVRLH